MIDAAIVRPIRVSQGLRRDEHELYPKGTPEREYSGLDLDWKHSVDREPRNQP